MPEWFCLYLYFERWFKPFPQEETPYQSEDNLMQPLKIKLDQKTLQLFTCVYYFGIFARFHFVEI